MMIEISATEELYQSMFETVSDGILITDLETGCILFANPAAADIHEYALDDLIGLSMQTLIHVKSLPHFADFAGVIRQGGLFEMSTQHLRRDDSIISVEWRATAFNYQGRTCALAVIRDVSKRVMEEQQFLHRVDVRAHEQATLLEISQTLASTLELNPGMILDQLRVIIKYTHAGLFTLEDSTLIALAVRGSEQLEQAVPFQIRLDGKQTLETLFNEYHPIRIADISSNEPSANFLRTLLADGAAALLEGMRSWMWMPLAVKGRIIGGIGLARAERNGFTSHHAALAMTIANQVAVAMANTELHEHARMLAALQERQRLAQNLHDAVNQSLFSAGLIAEVLPRVWERDPKEARRSLEDLRRLTRGAQAEMRVLLAELRPTALTDAELGDLLLLLGNAFTGRTNVPVLISVSGEGGLPAEVQVGLYRICQEALNNIVKYARANQVQIDLKYAPWGVELRIDDDGCGFVTSASIPPGHYGLGMMHERAKSVGATLTITSQPNQGTQMVIRWERQAST